MSKNPRRLKPGDLITLLNSTPLGQVVTDSSLRKHRQKAGTRIGDGKTIDLLRYAAWMCREEIAADQAVPIPAGADSYQIKKLREAARNREKSVSGRDIGELPAVVNPERRARASKDFEYHCLAYYPNQFELPFADDHREAITVAKRAVLVGGLFALAMPRGSGKSILLCEKLVEWAALNGLREYLLVLGVTAEAANEILANIKSDLEHNDALLEDYPEVCYPLRRLEGRAANCVGQLYKGEQTHSQWAADMIVFPAIPGSKASNIVIRAAGLTGRLRGMAFTRPCDGRRVRPDFVGVDDPQTDETAMSAQQNRQREKLLGGAVLGLAGPGKKIAGMMPCTVICRGDMADKILDPHLHPEWQGKRCKLIYEFPTNMDLWEQYDMLRRESLRMHGDIRLATDFYKRNRPAMDEGSRIMWNERHEPDEISGLQFGMNLYFTDREVFFAEYQNDPEGAASSSIKPLDPEAVAARVNGLERFAVPHAATKITAFIDVQHSLLYYAVIAWREGFGGSVVAYGAWPEQPRAYFKLSQADPVLADRYPGRSVQAAVYAGLKDLTEFLLDHEFEREDGARMKIDRCLVDGKDQAVAEEIYTLCRTSKFANLHPSGGKYIGPSEMPMSDYTVRPGEQLGRNWLRKKSAKHSIMHFVVDTNFWKAFLVERLEVAPTERNALTLYGAHGKRVNHTMLADHCVSEYAEVLSSDKTGRSVKVFKAKPGRPDNHLFDCLVGCAVAASYEGIKLEGTGEEPAKKKRERITFAEMRRRRGA